MSKKTFNIIFWVSTGLLSLMMLASAGKYFFDYETVSGIIMDLGFPKHIVYPLAVAKILGVAAILSGLSQPLKEWAYAGFFFDFALAFQAHIVADDQQFLGAVIATVLLFVSYFSDKKRQADSAESA